MQRTLIQPYQSDRERNPKPGHMKPLQFLADLRAKTDYVAHKSCNRQCKTYCIHMSIEKGYVRRLLPVL